MNKNMMERVCRAMCEAAGLDPDRKFKSSNFSDETAPHEFAWQEFLPEARAAINAMREPTSAMLNAGYDQEPTGASLIPSWEAMIDAALEGK